MVTLRDYRKGEQLSFNKQNFILETEVPFWHKIALETIKSGEDVIKYGYPIRKARRDIYAGEWIHTHNMQMKLEGTLQYQYQPKKLTCLIMDFTRAGVVDKLYILLFFHEVNKIKADGR